MLSYKHTFLHYNSSIKIRSFNTNSINSFVWNIRNNIKYIFFFFLKKTFFIKICFHYQLILLFFKLKRSLLVVDLKLKQSVHNVFFYNQMKSLSFFFVFYRSFFLYDSVILRTDTLFFVYNVLRNNITLSTIHYFFTFYRNALFISYIWLYSIKFFYFFYLNTSSLPTQRSLYTVLRSPHKDKKAREQFKLNKLKKTFLYPSFLNSYNNLIFCNFVNESVLIQNNISMFI